MKRLLIAAFALLLPVIASGQAVTIPPYTTLVQPQTNSGSGGGGGNGVGNVNGVLNVKDAQFHAVGDGVADDTASLQSAISSGTTGKFVYIPPGTYKITKPLSEIVGAGATVSGAGSAQSIIDSSSYVGPTLMIGAQTLVTTAGPFANTTAIVGSALTNPTLALSEIIGSHGKSPLAGDAQLDIRFWFKPAGSDTGGEILDDMVFAPDTAAFNPPVGAFRIWDCGTNQVQAEMVIGGVEKLSPCSSAITADGATWSEIEASYDGSNLRLFINGTLQGSATAATGTITQPDFDRAVFFANGGSWPEMLSNNFSWWNGAIGAIEFANVARHTSSYTADTSYWTADGNTQLLITWDSPSGATVAGTQTVYLANGNRAWLPVLGTTAQNQVPTLTLKNLTFTGPLVAIWTTGSVFTDLMAGSADTAIPAFDFYDNDFLNHYERLFGATLHVPAICFNFGTASNENLEINNQCNSQTAIEGYFHTGGGSEDINPRITDWGSYRVYWYFSQGTAHQSYPFVDSEAGNTNLITAYGMDGVYQPIKIDHGQIPSNNNAPFFTLMGGGSQFYGVEATGTLFSNASGTAAELVNVLNPPTVPVVLKDVVIPANISRTNASNGQYLSLQQFGRAESLAVANLWSCAAVNTGARVDVTDCTTCTYGATCTGGGVTYCREVCTGSSWVAQ